MPRMNTFKVGTVDAFDTKLGYDRSRAHFEPGRALELDAAYRLAHLPLVNPDHPDCIKSVAGKAYEMGLHGRIHSLVLPVSQTLLEVSPAFQALQDEVKASSFTHKIAWNIVEQRRGRLHATICGSLGDGETAPVLQPLQQPYSLRIKIGGLFSGTVNTGRLYLMLYPESHNDINILQLIQKQLGRPQTDLYLIGLYNMTDHLTVEETADLAALIERWWNIELLIFDVETLWLMSSLDDLVLDSRVETVVHLRSNTKG